MIVKQEKRRNLFIVILQQSKGSNWEKPIL